MHITKHIHCCHVRGTLRAQIFTELIFAEFFFAIYDVFHGNKVRKFRKYFRRTNFHEQKFPRILVQCAKFYARKKNDFP